MRVWKCTAEFEFLMLAATETEAGDCAEAYLHEAMSYSEPEIDIREIESADDLSPTELAAIPFGPHEGDATVQEWLAAQGEQP